jgi:LysM repeat protein
MVLNKFLEYVEQKSTSTTLFVQLCQGDGRGADYGVGIIAGSVRNFGLVQETVKTWADGKCIPNVGGDTELMEVTIRVPKADPKVANSTEIVTLEEVTSPAHIWPRSTRGLADLAPRAVCRSIKVQAGDGCWALANRCKITQENLTKFNRRTNFCNTLVIGEPVCCSTGTLPETIPPGNSDGTCKTKNVFSGDSCGSLASKCGLSSTDFMKVNTKKNLCSTLAVGQPVCCTRGDLPDVRPKPKPSGYCFDYTIQKDDICSSIAARNGLTVANLESFNKNTWGWNGCKLLYPNTKMCLSTGTAPMPAPVSVSCLTVAQLFGWASLVNRM